MHARVVWIEVTLIALGLAAANEVWFNRETKLKRQMRRFPLASCIANTPESQDVRVRGTLVLDENATPLIAPFSERPCAAWRVIVEAGAYWQEVHRDEGSVNFILEDESACAHVDGTSVSFSLAVQMDVAAHGTFFKASPSVVRFCASRGIETLGRRLRVREGILEVGERVTVCGRGRFENDVNAKVGYRGQASVLRIRALESGELLASDDPKLV